MTAPGQPVTIANYRPGALGRVCQMQSVYYAREWGFGRAFEAKIAAEMAEFLRRFDPACDLFEIAECAGEVVGSITIAGAEDDGRIAHLRWFIVSDKLRGGGIGARLLERGVAFARDRGFEGLYLTTFDGLATARHLYERAGFVLVHARRTDTWGPEMEEQRFELRF